MAYLLDTCALIWWTLGSDQLSKKAKLACGKMTKNEAYISSISLWEIGLKLKTKSLILGWI